MESGEGIMAKLYKFQQKGFLCDTTLVSAEGQTVSVHALVLAAASPGFANILHRMQDRSEQIGHLSVNTSLNEESMLAVIQKAYGHIYKNEDDVDITLDEHDIVSSMSLDNYQSTEQDGVDIKSASAMNTADTTIKDIAESQRGIRNVEENVVLVYYTPKELELHTVETQKHSDYESKSSFQQIDTSFSNDTSANLILQSSYNARPGLSHIDQGLNTSFVDGAVLRKPVIEQQHTNDKCKVVNVDERPSEYEQYDPLMEFDSSVDEGLNTFVTTNSSSHEMDISEIHTLLPSNCSTVQEETDKVMTSGIFQKRFPCSHCDKKFSRSHDAQTHMRVHTGDRPYMCGMCGKSFAQIGNLRKHERIHTGKKPYSCDECHKRFSDLSGLRCHVTLVHVKPKAHACQTCGNRFSLKSSLRRHQFTHTGLCKPFQCNLCEKAFPSIRNLNRHHKTHTTVSFPISRHHKE